MNCLHNAKLKLPFFLLSLSFFAVPVFAAVQPVDFYGAKAYGNGGSYYYDMVSGDFDGDGKSDIAASSYNNFLVFYGDGKGGFSSAAVTAYTSPRSTDIHPVVGDFNGDGRSDIAFIDRNPANNLTSIAVIYGSADRSFSQPTFSNSNSPPIVITAVDFDNDGKLDLLGQARNPGNVIRLYKGGGDGTFTAGGQINTNYQATNIIAGDFNNDGLPDISYSDSDDLQISQNLGNGTFGSPITVDSISYGFNSKVIADVNNDGKNDLIAVQNTFHDPVAAVWLGNGNLTFTQSPDFIIPSKDDVYLRQSADINNDKNQDLIFSSKNRTIISRGLGNGTFAQANSYVDGGGGLLVVNDFNSDKWLDIAAIQSVEFGVLGSGSFAVLLNQQDGSFRSAPALETGDGTNDIAAADFNGDGLTDFVVVNRDGSGGGDIVIFTQTNASNFADKSVISSEKLLGSIGIDTNAVITGDFNRDGKPDILVAGRAISGRSENALILINQGNGNFVPTYFQIGTDEIYDTAGADFNADGNLDLITSGYLGVSVSLGRGNGTFNAPVSYFTNIPSSQIAVGDFNNDAKIDIAVVNYTINKIGILFNNGSGMFADTLTLGISGVPSAVAAADLNSDGQTDLIVAKSSGISVVTGKGNGAFNPEVTYQILPVSASRLSVADFNGDGTVDVASLAGTNSISILLNNGAGELGNETVWGGGAVLSAIAAADLNNDKKTDLVFGFTVFLNGYTKILFNLTEKPAVLRKTLFDFDGDGKADISVFRPDSGVWYLLNSQSGFTATQFGSAADKIVPADYDGDGKTDLAVYRSGTWYLNRSHLGFTGIAFGEPNDIPQPADFDGDGKTDLAVWRPSNGTWYVYNLATNQFTAAQFGAPADKPVVGDYNGDGKADYAVFRPSDGTWYIARPSGVPAQNFDSVQFGDFQDKPVQADYDGDGKTDVAVFRPSNGIWYRLNSSNGQFTGMQFGISTDLPVPADYDGDGKTDIAVFRDGIWYLNQTSAGFTGVQFGKAADQPIPNALIR